MRLQHRATGVGALLKISGFQVRRHHRERRDGDWSPWGWGKSWVYDVHLLAGFPNGTIFDALSRHGISWLDALTRAAEGRPWIPGIL